jgi:HAD superfamily hydrolase (TIGR01490 family)
MSTRSRVAAFFDIDGTLLAAPSLEWRFVSWLVANDLLTAWQISSWVMSAVPAAVCGNASSVRTNKSYLAGLPESLVETWSDSLSAAALEPFPRASECTAWHLDRGHRVFLLSGTLAPLARSLARRVAPSIEVRATHLEVKGGVWTGLVQGNHMSGNEKALALAELAARENLSLADSHAYGNHGDDLPMLSSVGHPVAVNPSRRLKRLAVCRGWQIADWKRGVAAMSASPVSPCGLAQKDAQSSL